MVPYIAAFLTIAALGFDPFVQQLLTIQNQVVPVPASGISINLTTSMMVDISVAMKYPETLAQLAAAMLADVQQQNQPNTMASKQKRSESTTQKLALPLRAECPSGNCIWQPYYALDICTACRTTTQEVTMKDLSPNSSDLPAMISDAQAGRRFNSDEYQSKFKWEIVPNSGRAWQVEFNVSAFVNENDMDGTPLRMEVHGAIAHKVVCHSTLLIRMAFP